MIGWRDADAQGVFHEEAAALKKPGMVDTFRLTVKHEGVRALYKGLVPNSLKVGHQQ
jgi:solute carrier family 25 phosphate transporter 23/24/25/41